MRYKAQMRTVTLGERRKSMIDVPLPVANVMFTASNIVGIVGALCVVAGAFGAFWFGGVRDRYADERISANEAETATAKAEGLRITQSNIKLAVELEKERNERLRLEAKIAPRHLTPEQKVALVKTLRGSGWSNAEIIWHGDGEPEAYARDLASAFEDAHIKTFVHTLGPFIPSAWGLMSLKTRNGDGDRLHSMLIAAGVTATVAETNATIGEKDHPTLFVGSRED